MGAKLDQGMYKDRAAFEQDFRLMISNAKLYNAPRSYPYDEASKLEAYFEKGTRNSVVLYYSTTDLERRMGSDEQDVRGQSGIT